MFNMFFVTFMTAMLLLCLFSPSVRRSIMTGDDVLDAHESGLALVASRNPFRETGPPACMAKLIMLRHKMQNSTRRRRSLTPSRQAARNFVLPPPRTMNRPPWIRFGKQFGIQHH